MKIVRKGQIVTLKPEYLGRDEENLPHVALEDSFNGTVRVEVAGEIPGLRFKPVNIWRVEWIALDGTEDPDYPFGVWCTVSGGVTGSRQGWLRDNGRIVAFATQTEAIARAVALREGVSPHARATFTYEARRFN